jgi:hypothetical protein
MEKCLLYSVALPIPEIYMHVYEYGSGALQLLCRTEASRKLSVCDIRAVLTGRQRDQNRITVKARHDRLFSIPGTSRVGHVRTW